MRRVDLPLAADLPGRLVDMVRATPWLLEALRAARDVDPPDWLVGRGVLRDLVWDRLLGPGPPHRATWTSPSSTPPASTRPATPRSSRP